jgi:hypothetical protein
MKRARNSSQKKQHQQPATASNSTATTVTNPNATPTDVIEIDVEEIGDKDQSQSNNPQSKKQSWVWLHFKDTPDGKGAICQVINKNNQICNRTIAKDKSSSTKNFHDQLSNVHKLMDPKLHNKIEKSQTDIGRWAKSGKLTPKVLIYFHSFTVVQLV